MGRRETRVGVGHFGVCVVEQIVANAVVKSKPIGDAPGILQVEGVLVDVRSGKRTVGSSASECLGEAEWVVRSEIGIAVECVRAAEIAGKEIIDVLEIEIETCFERVAAVYMRKAFRP